MKAEDVIEYLINVLKELESVDFLSREKSIQSRNQLKVHKAYNTIDELKNKLQEVQKSDIC